MINFTVVGGVYASDISADIGADVGEVPLMGTVRFIPEMPLHSPAALAPEYVPPAAIVPREFVGVIDDGVLKNVRAGTAGVRLWANDPVLRLENLAYRIVFDGMTDRLGNPVEVQGGTFYAPAVDTVMYLTSLIGIPGVKGVNGRDRWIDGGTPARTGAEHADGGGI